MADKTQPFPLDSATLIMLAASCEINDDTERTHLHDFLSMGAREQSRTEIASSETFDSGDEIPVYEVVYEDGCAPFSPHDAILALVAEVLRLRGEV